MLELKKIMEEMIKTDNVRGLAVAVIKDGKIISNETAGIGNVFDGKELELKKDTKFRIASISKLITTIGFMKLVEKKLISLDDDISSYLGMKLRNPRFPDTVITPRMLLSHTSSIRDGDYYTAPMPCTMEDFFTSEGRYYEKGKHFADSDKMVPGEYFTYSNLNFGLIASMIENISGKRFDRYMKEEVFEKLGISASYNVKDFGKEMEKVGTLYRKAEEKWTPQVDDYNGIEPETSWYTYAIGDDLLEEDENIENISIDDYVLGSNGTLFSPHGGLRISAEDLAKIMEMLINRGKTEGKAFLEEETLRSMETSYWDYNGENGDTMDGLMCNYGMSVHHLRESELEGELKNIDGYMGHTGEAYGMLSGMFYKPEKKSGWAYYITGTGLPLEEAAGKDSPFTMWEETFIKKIVEYIK